MIQHKTISKSKVLLENGGKLILDENLITEYSCNKKFTKPVTGMIVVETKSKKEIWVTGQNEPFSNSAKYLLLEKSNIEASKEDVNGVKPSKKKINKNIFQEKINKIGTKKTNENQETTVKSNVKKKVDKHFSKNSECKDVKNPCKHQDKNKCCVGKNEVSKEKNIEEKKPIVNKTKVKGKKEKKPNETTGSRTMWGMNESVAQKRFQFLLEAAEVHDFSNASFSDIHKVARMAITHSAAQIENHRAKKLPKPDPVYAIQTEKESDAAKLQRAIKSYGKSRPDEQGWEKDLSYDVESKVIKVSGFAQGSAYNIQIHYNVIETPVKRSKQDEKARQAYLRTGGQVTPEGTVAKAPRGRPSKSGLNPLPPKTDIQTEQHSLEDIAASILNEQKKKPEMKVRKGPAKLPTKVVPNKKKKKLEKPKHKECDKE